MDWVRGEKLGRGSFGMVNLAVPRSHSHVLPSLMAVKSCQASQSSSLLSEKFVLEELKDCPEIVRCFGESFSHENGERLYNVLLEFAPGGSLADKLKNSDCQRLPESEVRQYTRALLRGLRYIHRFGYVHCDIKLRNILVGPDGGVKIADFGLAKRAGRRSAVAGCELRGTPLYMSPEMVAGGEQGAPSDIWALGCAVSEMVSGSPAWCCSDVAALLMRIGVGEEVPEIPGILSEEGKDFLGKCFVKDPSKRWTAEMLLRHPFVCCQDLGDDCIAASREGQENKPSTSPRCPFDFPDWVTSATCSITSLPSPGNFPGSGICCSEESNLTKERSWSVSPVDLLRGLVSVQGPNWSISDDWVPVR